jgi:hypothetical protein
MSLKLTYEMTCDFCGANIGGKDEYTLAPYAPAQDMRLPSPRTNGCGLGEWMACPECIHKAREAVKVVKVGCINEEGRKHG